MLRTLLVLCFVSTQLQPLHAASSTFYGATPYTLIAPVSPTTLQPTGYFPTRFGAGTLNTMISPDGKTVLIQSCASSCEVTAVNIATSKTVQTYKLTFTPTGAMTVLPGESRLFVATCPGGIQDIVNVCANVYVEVFSVVSGAKLAAIPISLYNGQNPAGLIHQLTASPNGATVYLDDVLCTGAFEDAACHGFIIPINAVTLRTGASFNFCNQQCEANPLVVSADSKTGYIFAGGEDDPLVVDIVNLAQMTQTGTITLPAAIFGGSIAISADGSTLCVNLHAVPSPELVFIDTATQAIASTAEGVSGFPAALSSDGSTAWTPAAVTGLQVVNAKTGTVTTELTDLPILELSLSTNGSVLNLLVGGSASGLFNSGGIVSYPEASAAPKVLELGQPMSWLAISPDSGTVYSANQNGISAVSTSTGAVTSQMLPGVNIAAVAVSSYGSTLYALSAVSSSFTVLNSSTGAVEASVPIPACSGASSGSIALQPAGGQAYVMLNCDPVVPINLATLKAGVPIANTSGSALAVSPFGAYLFAGAGNSLDVINLTTGQVAVTLPITASSIAFSPNGKWAYLAGTSNNQQGIGVINTSTLTLATFVPLPNAGGGGESIAVSQDGLFIYVGTAAMIQPQLPVQVAVVNALTFKVSQYLLASPPFVVR